MFEHQLGSGPGEDLIVTLAPAVNLELRRILPGAEGPYDPIVT